MDAPGISDARKVAGGSLSAKQHRLRRLTQPGANPRRAQRQRFCELGPTGFRWDTHPESLFSHFRRRHWCDRRFLNHHGHKGRWGNTWGPASGAFTNGDALIWAIDLDANAGTAPVSFVFTSGFVPVRPSNPTRRVSSPPSSSSSMERARSGS
ncbi:hypothetical protein SBA3_220007 [Candidatus Sulfopaludibacter sp. SbA3]|nr:hypothetical protein SBA3_220007 [Candidatus Sulfopaludibacter sp. SbA3]